MRKWSKKEILFITLFFSSIWVGIPLWIWKSLPSDAEYRNKRIYDIEQTLKTQKLLVDLALMEEINSEFPSTDRIIRLERIQKMLHDLDEF